MKNGNRQNQFVYEIEKLFAGRPAAYNVIFRFICFDWVT